MESELREATSHRLFTSEDFRDLNLHKYMHPNAIGVFFTRLVRQGKIERVGISKATHKKAHSHTISVWKWT